MIRSRTRIAYLRPEGPVSSRSGLPNGSRAKRFYSAKISCRNRFALPSTTCAAAAVST